MKKYKITYGEIINKENDDMPQLEIIVTDITTPETAKLVRKYYLSPFRLYRFQVSGNDNGYYDCGSSEVVGLGNLIDMRPNTPDDTMGFSAFSSNLLPSSYGKYMMYAMANEAIFNFCENRMKAYSYDDQNEISIILNMHEYEDTILLWKFIETVYEYTRNKTESYR